MKTCEDCIHYDICLGAFGALVSRVCDSFKDKSKFIELPRSLDKNQSLQEYMNNLNSISYEDLEIALEQIEYGNNIIRKWLIDNNCLEVT